MRHSYPGNVRELKNLIEHAVAMCEGTRIDGRDLDFGAAQAPSTVAGSLRDALEGAEQEAIRLALDHSGWAMAQAAAILGISRKNLWEKMRRYGIGRDAEE
jgi:two-component system response regulator AtoC